MNQLSNQAKAEILHALEGKQSGLFVIDRKPDLAEEIENYPQLKASLQKYLDHPDMKGYTANELKEKRRDRRK